MPANVEVKIAVADPVALEERIRRISGTPPEVLHQEDTFFHSGTGRLKLRRFADGSGELIAYSRDDRPGSRRSDYLIVPTGEPGILGTVLATALGVRGVVRKVRRLYRKGNTRIHLDEVEGLGTFLELEVVLQPGQAETEGHATVSTILGALGLVGAPRIGCAYIDMLLPDAPVKEPAL